jgi:hypothetical protein
VTTSSSKSRDGEQVEAAVGINWNTRYPACGTACDAPKYGDRMQMDPRLMKVETSVDGSISGVNLQGSSWLRLNRSVPAIAEPSPHIPPAVVQ